MGSFIEWLQPFVDAIISTIASFWDPKKRIYYPYLVAAFIWCLLYYQFKRTNRPAQSFRAYLKYLFSKKIWLHPSALVDYQLFFLNNLLKAILITPYLMAHMAFAYLVVRWWEAGIGLQDNIQWSTTSINLSYTLVFLIFSDFSRFFLHYLLHKIPFLWEFHKVHHSAKVLTPITLYRMHPVEYFLFRLRSLIVFGLVTGSFFFWFRTGIEPLSILQIHLGIFVFNIMGANLRHSHVPISFGKILEHIFISPAQHQIHHSQEERHYDKNFGSLLAFWDGLWGSLFISRPNEKLSFGISQKEDPQFRSLWQNLWMPFKNLWLWLRAHIYK
ncbi:sterol desaturase family protein [Aureispira anguillae]|uniref:Sterol desaturase family protein n=1 Tax=Aureispira anguillae TaxID=2864201 RepID=A0A915YBV5_9BACT|nr:sterol desaturase family protein [Aureispira anguillae]BDS10153.1 sterol desaturase family protein [Aureispira anguillae]